MENALGRERDRRFAHLLPFTVSRYVLFCFLGAFITANGDLFATNFHFDATIIDCPITHRTLFGIHHFSPSALDVI